VTAPGIPNDLVLSTSCFGSRLRSIEDQAFAAVAMGFRKLELGLSEQPVEMNGFEDTQRETGMQVTSVVAGCLKPKSPNMVSTLLGSPNADEREQALNSVRRHVRLAQRHTSPVVVLRGTNVRDADLNRESEQLQRELLTEGLSEELKDRMVQFSKKVAERAQPQLEHLCRSLHQLRREFPETRLALEPGSRPDDILGFEAMGWVLDDLERQGIGYWHDVGDVHLREQAGLPSQGRWLDTYASRMHGVHLRDAANGEAGLPPGQGEVDFRLVSSYLPADSARVVEIHPRHGRTQILDSVRFLVEQGF
jgi:sugar phosphate isomerase/epimerase